VHPDEDLTPDAALDLLLYQPGAGNTRKWLRKRLTNNTPIAQWDKACLSFLCCVYHLPAACKPVLAVLVCGRTEGASPQDAAGRVQRLRAHACEYV
jgi:hypothetical protein